MTNDMLGKLIEVMIDDYQSYTGHTPEGIYASPDLMDYILSRIENHYVTLEPDGRYRIAGVLAVRDPNMNRGKIEIR